MWRGFLACAATTTWAGTVSAQLRCAGPISCGPSSWRPVARRPPRKRGYGAAEDTLRGRETCSRLRNVATSARRAVALAAVVAASCCSRAAARGPNGKSSSCPPRSTVTVLARRLRAGCGLDRYRKGRRGRGQGVPCLICRAARSATAAGSGKGGGVVRPRGYARFKTIAMIRRCRRWQRKRRARSATTRRSSVWDRGSRFSARGQRFGRTLGEGF